MPTGYTANIKDGITFKQYAMTCARAFGACVELRDDPLADEIPVFTVGDYYPNALANAKQQLALYISYTDEEAEQGAQLDYDAELANIKRAIDEANDLEKKYNAMLVEARNWVAPTPAHAELKSFMMQQLLDSIRFDCGSYYYKDKVVTKLTGPVWRAHKITVEAKRITDYTESLEKEQARVIKNNEWVNALKESL
jgi:hypothetical protein